VITLGCSKTYTDSDTDGSTTCKRKDVAQSSAAEEGNIIVINTCFIDNAKAESVNMILEYADKKKKGLVDKVLLLDVYQNVTDRI
jgi:ribosomal protein S12 methylthiotransferase